MNGTAEAKRKLLETLSHGAKTHGEIAEAASVGVGGHVSAALDELVEAGFVSRDSGLNPENGAQVREVRYRISDNYIRFYLRFIAPRANPFGRRLSTKGNSPLKSPRTVFSTPWFHSGN